MDYNGKMIAYASPDNRTFEKKNNEQKGARLL